MPKAKFSPTNPMPKTFTAIVPLSLKAASETYQFAPAVRIGDQILISGMVGFDAEGRLPPDFRSQAENVFTTLEAILNEAGATLDDVASLSSYHAGDLHSQLRELVDIGDADPAAAPGLDGRRGDAARGARGAPRNICRGDGPRLLSSSTLGMTAAVQFERGVRRRRSAAQ